MKLPVHVLAWPLTLSVALASEEKLAAEARIKEELLKRDEEKYKDAVIHLDFHKDPFLGKVEGSDKKLANEKKKILRQASSEKSSATHPDEESDETLNDAGNLRLYQIGAPSTGLVPNSDEQVENIYMVVDRETKKGSTSSSSKVVGSPQVDMEGKLHHAEPITRLNDKSKEDPPVLSSEMEGRIRHLGRSGDEKRRRKSNKVNKKFSRQLRQSQNNGEATGNPHQDNKVLLNGCVQGTASFVTDKCQFFNCCDGEHACEWPDDQIATVCPDSCNGYKACYYIGAGTYVGSESCNSGFRYGYACAYFASTSTKSSSTIGTNSCNGNRACAYICYSSGDCKASIGNDACNGAEDCSHIGEPRYDRNFLIVSVSVGDGSCNSYGQKISDGEACNYVGSHARLVSIGEGSCLGEDACFELGYYAPLRVKVGDGSCTDEDACNGLGEDAGADGYKSKVLVGDGSCTGYEACFALGEDTYRDVQVGDNACANYQSCFDFGEDVEGQRVRIEDNQCRLPQQCSARAIDECETTATVPNSGGLCPDTS